jgi:hypothetical protein
VEELKILKLKSGEVVPRNYTGCVEYNNGTKAWYKEGKLHREAGPAVEYADGIKFWYCEGKCHRLDGPAIEHANGTNSWFIEGNSYSEEEWKKKVEESKILKLKNHEVVPENYTGCAEYSNGNKFWFKEGICHREDGPAIIFADGTKSWYKEGKFHRLDGPAIEYPDGTKQWLIEGERHRLDGPAIECTNGAKEWYKEGKLHRLDGPAIERADGTNSWYKEGKVHRLDGPAIECTNGEKHWYIEGKEYSEADWKKKVEESKILKLKNHEVVLGNYTGCAEYDNGNKFWYKEGKFHRVDGPAVECANGEKQWFIEGKRHRLDGPAIEYIDGSKEWYVDGNRHRLDGSAIEWVNGTKEWYKEGKLHRLDGPAIEYRNGEKSWYIEGKKYFEEEFNKKTKQETVKIEKENDSLVVSDLKKATTRVAVEKLTTAAKGIVVKATPKKSKKTVSKLVNNSFFDYFLGVSLGTVKDSLPEKIKKPAAAVSEELRVSSAAKIETQLLNLFLPALGSDSKLDNFSKMLNDSTNIRVEVPVKTIENVVEQEEEQVTKEKRTL